MIETKVLEIRDNGTFVSALAIRNQGSDPVQQYYFDRCGFPEDGSSITLMKMYDQWATNDPYGWGDRGDLGSRTMVVAHQYIIEHFDTLADGDVVDVEHILGQTASSKKSERWTVAAR